MNDQDALIDLLNGVDSSRGYGKFDTDVFLDEDGIPTDRFLQALKSDMTTLPSFQDLNESIYKEETTRQFDREFQPDRNAHRRLVTDDEYFGDAKRNRSNHNVKFDYDDMVESLPDDDFISSAPFSMASKRTKPTKVPKEKKPPKKVKQAKPSAYSNETRSSAANLTERSTSSSSLKQRSTSGASTATSHIMNGGHTAGTMASSHSVEEVHFPRAVGIDTTEIEVEAESRVKSLQLRLQGQLQTIRSLETQLGDALQLVEARNKQLAHCNARLKATSAAAAQTGGNNGTSGGASSNVTTVGGGNVTLRSEAAAAKATELAEQYKVQADFLQAKLAEEQGKRQRSEERARVLKNYSEKAKARCLELEAQNAELKGAIAEVTARMEKYRKSYKEIASESAAQRAEVGAKDEEAGKLRRQLDKTESAVRNLQMALEHSRQELRTQKVETSAAQSKYKQLALQVEIEQERTATRRAEERLRSMGDAGRETRREAHASEGAAHGQGRERAHSGHSYSSHTYSSLSHAIDASPRPDRADATHVTAQQQLQYLQHLAGVSRAHPSQHLNLADRLDHIGFEDLPPAPPVHENMRRSRESVQSYDDRAIRASIDRSEESLDRDVVLETMLSQNYADAPRLPPRWRQNDVTTSQTGSVSSSNAERSLLSARAEQRSHSAGAGRHLVSMSDSELDQKDLRHSKAADVRSSAEFERSAKPRSSSAVSFIRQQVIGNSGSRGSYSTAGSNNSGLATFSHHHQYPDRSAGAQPASPSRGHAGLSSPSPSKMQATMPQPGSAGSASSAGSGGGSHMNRLQALYEKVANKST